MAIEPTEKPSWVPDPTQANFYSKPPTGLITRGFNDQEAPDPGHFNYLFAVQAQWINYLTGEILNLRKYIDDSIGKFRDDLISTLQGELVDIKKIIKSITITFNLDQISGAYGPYNLTNFVTIDKLEAQTNVSNPTIDFQFSMPQASIDAALLGEIPDIIYYKSMTFEVRITTTKPLFKGLLHYPLYVYRSFIKEVSMTLFCPAKPTVNATKIVASDPFSAFDTKIEDSADKLSTIISFNVSLEDGTSLRNYLDRISTVTSDNFAIAPILVKGSYSFAKSET